MTTLLAIDWTVVGIKTLQFILSFSILVTLHELGHYLTARWFKCRVEKFYLFFNPWFSLWKKKIGDTEYGIGWIPFGGYVKISGMIDESMDKEQMQQPPQPYEFRSKPAWQRLIIMVGGVVVNLLLGFFIYAMMLWYWGDSYVPTNQMTYGIAADSLAESIGFRDGDKVLSADGEYVDRFEKIPLNVVLNSVKSVQVSRNGQQVNIPIPEDFPSKLIHFKDLDFIDVRLPTTPIDSIAGDTSAAYKAGLRKGDLILSVNGQSTQFFSEFREIIRKQAGKEASLTYLRGGDTATTSILVPATGVIGIYNGNPANFIQVKKIDYTFLESLPAGLKKSWDTLVSYWLQLKLIFSGKVNTNESLGSVISIGKMFPDAWDWRAFWAITAFFSLVLALMNILPIPGLDGGHALFTLFEMITGRKPSDRFMEVAQMTGMVLLLGLMTYALGLDFWRLFK